MMLVTYVIFPRASVLSKWYISTITNRHFIKDASIPLISMRERSTSTTNFLDLVLYSSTLVNLTAATYEALGSTSVMFVVLFHLNLETGSIVFHI